MKVYFGWQYRGAAGLEKEIASSREMTWLTGQAHHHRVWGVLSEKTVKVYLGHR